MVARKERRNGTWFASKPTWPVVAPPKRKVDPVR
jgi:hypothetical protein